MPATINNIETYTGDRESYDAILRVSDAQRLPVRGIVKRYRGFQYDDFGNRQMVFISSAECPNEDGQITWSEAFVSK